MNKALTTVFAAFTLGSFVSVLAVAKADAAPSPMVLSRELQQARHKIAQQSSTLSATRAKLSQANSAIVTLNEQVAALNTQVTNLTNEVQTVAESTCQAAISSMTPTSAFSLLAYIYGVIPGDTLNWTTSKYVSGNDTFYSFGSISG